VNIKIAIPLFGKKISPRFDLSPELWIITVENGEVVHQEKISMTNFNLFQRIRHLNLNGVNKVICGGIHDFGLDQLRNMGIDVFHNTTGEADVALDVFLKGRLEPGSQCEKIEGRFRTQKRCEQEQKKY